MDVFRIYAQFLQFVLKMLLAVVATALFFTARLVTPALRSAVVALVRFPAIVADRHYDSQRTEIEWLLAEARRAARANAKAPVPIAQIVPGTRATPASASDSTEPERVDRGEAEQAPVPTSAAVEVPASDAEPTPEPDPEDHVEVDEGPVLRYRPKQALGD